jgi:hypothetical protein
LTISVSSRWTAIQKKLAAIGDLAVMRYAVAFAFLVADWCQNPSVALQRLPARTAIDAHRRRSMSVDPLAQFMQND